MNSTRSLKLAKVLLFATLGVGLSSTLGQAQQYQGKFTLPFEARWGMVTLPPGEYSIELDTATHPYITIRHGTSGRGFVMTNAITEDTVSGHSALLAFSTGDSYRIRMFHVEELGLTLNFNSPKAERPLLAQGTTLNRHVAVLLARK
jgi:hypothetical protein